MFPCSLKPLGGPHKKAVIHVAFPFFRLYFRGVDVEIQGPLTRDNPPFTSYPGRFKLQVTDICHF